jgi:glycosyltransferase involved in cell wall biosynthesis
MKVSVIVPAFNEERGLAESLRSIHTALEVIHAAGWSSELIVCDNNSTDRTADIARTAGAQVVFEPINQISRARNRGAAEASGDWLVFVDADSHPSPALCADMVSTIQAGRCVAGGSTVASDSTHRSVRYVLRFWNTLSRVSRWAAGSFIFCEAAAFRELGGFSQELYAGEEIELFRRLKRYARQRHRTIVILHRHPLLTSARKMHLYSRSEMTWFLIRTVTGRGRTLRRAEDCFSWYDGRR